MTQLEEEQLYRYVETPWQPSFWERGVIRYGIMSYSLWMRNIYWDVRQAKRPKAGRPMDPRLWWWEKRWTWWWGR